MKKTVLIIIAVILLVILGITIFSGDSYEPSIYGDEAKEELSQFEKLASLEFKDYEGNTVTLADFEGKPLIVNAWATWCLFCVKELADFATIQEEFGEDIVIIAIDRSESISSAKRFSDELGVTDKLVMLVDPGDDFYKQIGGFSMPETIFVSSEANIEFHKRGPMTPEEMRDRISQAFNL